MFDTGVLDSVAVVENSLRNSVSIASLVLTTGVSRSSSSSRRRRRRRRRREEGRKERRKEGRRWSM